MTEIETRIMADSTLKYVQYLSKLYLLCYFYLHFPLYSLKKDVSGNCVKIEK